MRRDNLIVLLMILGVTFLVFAVPRVIYAVFW